MIPREHRIDENNVLPDKCMLLTPGKRLPEDVKQEVHDFLDRFFNHHLDELYDQYEYLYDLYKQQVYLLERRIASLDR